MSTKMRSKARAQKQPVRAQLRPTSQGMSLRTRRIVYTGLAFVIIVSMAIALIPAIVGAPS